MENFSTVADWLLCRKEWNDEDGLWLAATVISLLEDTYFGDPVPKAGASDVCTAPFGSN